MALSNSLSLPPGTMQALPLQDRALTWACSACFHTLALAAVSVASVALREPPLAQPVLSRIEILLSETPSVAEQPAATSQASLDSTVSHETADLTEDLSPIVPEASHPIIQRAARRVDAETPLPQTAERSTTARDPLSAERSSPIGHHSEPPAPAAEPDLPASQIISEAIEQAEMPTAPNPPLEPTAKNFTEHGEPSPQPDISSSSPADASSTSGSPTEAMDSSTAPSAETVAMNHPVITQSLPASSPYAWLMDLLRRRIIRFQAYPRLARMQGWEGVVVVRTTINSDGGLIDAVVTKSSGYGDLDEDAVKLMHRVCPVHLTQELGKSKISVMVPIRYRLDGIAR